MFLDPAPVFTLVPQTETLFSIPTLTPPATTTGTVSASQCPRTLDGGTRTSASASASASAAAARAGPGITNTRATTTADTHLRAPCGTKLRCGDDRAKLLRFGIRCKEDLEESLVDRSRILGVEADGRIVLQFGATPFLRNYAVGGGRIRI